MLRSYLTFHFILSIWLLRAFCWNRNSTNLFIIKNGVENGRTSIALKLPLGRIAGSKILLEIEIGFRAAVRLTQQPGTNFKLCMPQTCSPLKKQLKFKVLSPRIINCLSRLEDWTNSYWSGIVGVLLKWKKLKQLPGFEPYIAFFGASKKAAHSLIIFCLARNFQLEAQIVNLTTT